MRSSVILRLVPFAALALFVASAVPARSAPFSVTRHVGVSLRRVFMQPGVEAQHGAARPVPLRVACPAAYRREKATADAGYQRWLRAHATAASPESAPLTSISGS